jgi:hypothetical protein
LSDYLLRLTPQKWLQEIRDYPTTASEGCYLTASCKAADDTDLELSNKAELAVFTVELLIMAGDRPLDADAHDKRGIGELRFQEAMPAGDDPPGVDSFLHGFLYLKPDSYAALWDQVRDGGYVDCTITINVGPVQYKRPAFFWDVSKPLVISSVALTFTRRPVADKPIAQAASLRGREGFAGGYFGIVLVVLFLGALFLYWQRG